MTIELAQRLQRIRPSATVSITARAQRLREQGRDIIVLSVGEPDFPTPEHVKAAAVAALARNDTKYTPVDGSRLLKEAIVAKLERDNGLRYAPEQVLVSTGAKQSCYNACLALLDPGDEAIVVAPYWVSYPDMVRLADAEPVIVATSAARGFKMTAEQLAGALTPKTRLLILNSPCNPTGAVYSAAELRALGDVLRAHPRVVVLSDEIYEHIQWTGSALASFAAVCPELYDRTLTVNGMSKGYAMSGWRIGYAAGPVPVIKAMTSLQGQSTTNACTISQAAAREALVGGPDVRARHVRRVQAAPRFFLRGRAAPAGLRLRAGRRHVLSVSERRGRDAREERRDRRRALRAPHRRSRRRARARHGVRCAGSRALLVRGIDEHARGRARASRQISSRR